MMDNEMWSLPDGTVLYNVHPPARCEGTPCWIHNPSDHKMRDWPMVRRASGLLERTCPHGVGHPDPDSLWFMKHILHLEGYGVHGCDLCCR